MVALTRITSSSRVYSAAWVFALCVVALALTFAKAHGRVVTPPCLFRTTTGIPCPGCGLTRSVEAIWRGDWRASLRFHPAGLPAFTGLIVVLLGSAVYLVWPGARPWIDRVLRVAGSQKVAISVLVFLLTLWLVRLLDAALGTGLFLW